MDLDEIELNLDNMPKMNLGDIMSGLDLSVSDDGMKQMASGLLEGYQAYAAEHPEADYSKLGEEFLKYLTTPDAQKILSDNIKEMIQNNGGITISMEQMQAMVTEILKGYQAYADAKGYTDPDKFDEYLIEYLQTEEAQGILKKWASEIFNIDGNVEITQEQLEKLAGELAAGYGEYASVNGLPAPDKMGEYFIDYLNTPAGKQQLSDGIAAMVDMESLESQVSGSVQKYMQEAMGVYMGALSRSLESQISSAMRQIAGQITGGLENAMQQSMIQVGRRLQSAMGDAMSIDADAFAGAFRMNMNEDELTELLMSLGSASSASYDNNLQKAGYVDFDVPSGINIYPTDFESKENVVKILDDYNKKMEAEGKEEQVITYTDVVGTLMSSVTDIVDIVSYVLIAFVAISLVVSSIMIGVITYISVLERKKEIGILRAIGASKKNISQVFNAETFIIGLCAGMIGIGLTLLILIPGNMLIHHLADSNDINAVLPVIPALILILLSVLLTLLGGLIPSGKASKSDPVTALRTE